jgi:bifunctional UDP-N-acetylglucosamine pyrophosphorylase/glucosamine-1-phosphate N-acetyltransferase
MICQPVILAAGFGTRMKSRIPKVLHPLGGKPLISWAVNCARDATGRDPVVIIGPEDQEVREVLGENVRYVEQAERLGTGHAVLQAAETLEGKSDLILVTLGDMPFLQVDSLKKLISTQEDARGALTMLTAKVSKSRGFGRILRDERGQILSIVEEAHASPEQLMINEVNVSVYCFEAQWLWQHLNQLPLSPKGEYYLTDIVAIAAESWSMIASIEVEDEEEIIGINTREHLAEAHEVLKRRINRRWMLSGVTIVDPSTTYIDPQATIGEDTTILPGTHIRGDTAIGRRCVLGPNSMIEDSSMGDRCQVTMSVVEGATLEEDVDIGPYAHLRRGAYLCRGVHMGNFGEVKNSTLGPGVKMGHFSYIGDAQIGGNTNVSAGVITCNFDGEKKHSTEVGEDVFFGSDTMLVAPLHIGRGSRTGAGSVVTRDVPENTLVAGIPARAIRKLEDGD